LAGPPLAVSPCRVLDCRAASSHRRCQLRRRAAPHCSATRNGLDLGEARGRRQSGSPAWSAGLPPPPTNHRRGRLVGSSAGGSSGLTPGHGRAAWRVGTAVVTRSWKTAFTCCV